MKFAWHQDSGYVKRLRIRLIPLSDLLVQPR